MFDSLLPSEDEGFDEIDVDVEKLLSGPEAVVVPGSLTSLVEEADEDGSPAEVELGSVETGLALVEEETGSVEVGFELELGSVAAGLELFEVVVGSVEVRSDLLELEVDTVEDTEGTAILSLDVEPDSEDEAVSVGVESMELVMEELDISGLE